MTFTCVASLAAPVVERNVEPVGPYYLAYARRKLHNRTFSEDEKLVAEEHFRKARSAVEGANGGADDDLELDEHEDAEMLSRDPKDWKNQDHYAVLGLSKYRYRATEDQIRRAHRKKVLRHHPDKKAAEGVAGDDGFFKMIQKAFETLMDPVRRRQYDSVDEEAEVLAPSRKAKGDFFELWRPVFEAEARFSNIQPVPGLGDAESSKQDVEQFYDFWYRFDSWRSFEYLDKDVPDDSDNRDNKRYQEKKNRNERQKRKVEDSQRLRKLVDDALSVDPRIKQFKQREKEERERRKWEREAGARAAAAEAARQAEEEARRKAEEEAAAKAAAADSKKAKEDRKKAVKKEKKIIKGACKDFNYFVSSGQDASAAEVDACLSDVELLMESFKGEQQAKFAAAIEAARPGGVDATRSVFASAISEAGIPADKLKFFK